MSDYKIITHLHTSGVARIFLGGGGEGGANGSLIFREGAHILFCPFALHQACFFFLGGPGGTGKLWGRGGGGTISVQPHNHKTPAP